MNRAIEQHRSMIALVRTQLDEVMANETIAWRRELDLLERCVQEHRLDSIRKEQELCTNLLSRYLATRSSSAMEGAIPACVPSRPASSSGRFVNEDGRVLSMEQRIELYTRSVAMQKTVLEKSTLTNSDSWRRDVDVLEGFLQDMQPNQPLGIRVQKEQELHTYLATEKEQLARYLEVLNGHVAWMQGQRDSWKDWPVAAGVATGSSGSSTQGSTRLQLRGRAANFDQQPRRPALWLPHSVQQRGGLVGFADESALL